MILVVNIFEYVSKIVCLDNNYLFLKFFNVNLWDKCLIIGICVYIFINLWSYYNFLKSF